MTAPAEHAPLSPSAASRWVACTGSVSMCQQFPESADSPKSMEGTAAHWVCAEFLAGRDQIALGTLAPNGIAVTQEMIEGAQMYYDAFPADAIGPGGSLVVEYRVSAPSIHPTDCWGTLDARYIKNGTIYIKDYKFGHAYVDVFENWQMIAYAAATLDEMPGLNDQLMRFEFTIVQPRCFHADGPVRTWSVQASDLRGYFNKLRAAAEKALSPLASLEVGPHCAYCPAIHACPAAQQAVQSTFDLAQTPIPSPLDPASLSLLLRRVKAAMGTLKAMGGGLEEEAESRIRQGERIPGFDLIPGRGKTEWNKSLDEVQSLGVLLGADFRKAGCVTPIQAKKMLKDRGMDEGIVAAYSEAKSGALQLGETNMAEMAAVFGRGV